ncbi:condensation domain-containing protein [Streptomyces goshikiensis]|uniref:condensation domain-containing protein n=1 Tax=Streptomyces goshikiensis TaxID=1942 RepID=UPI003685113F
MPASPAQEGVWLAHELEQALAEELVDGASAHSMVAAQAYALKGELDHKALCDALDAISLRHESLRTTFLLDEGGLRQVVREPGPCGIRPPVVIARGELHATLEAFFEEPFDLGEGPVWRSRLLRLAEEEHVLMVLFHHIANDGWSVDVFHRELADLYETAAETGFEGELLLEAAGLPALGFQYPDYAVWQREQDQSERYSASIDYWRRYLDGAPPLLELLKEGARPAVRSNAGGHIVHVMSEEVFTGVERLARELGVTPFAVQLAAFQALLADRSGQDDFVVGVAAANRSTPEAELLIGFFLNVLPLRARRAKDQTFRQYLTQTHRDLVQANKHGEVPLVRLLKELRIPRSAAYNPLFQVSVASHQAFGEPFALPGLDVTLLTLEDHFSVEDLTLYLTRQADGLKAHFVYRTDLFDGSAIESLARSYTDVLTRVARDPDLLVTGVDARIRGAQA